jgi:quercetin dioxygenase-like cupin family protein
MIILKNDRAVTVRSNVRDGIGDIDFINLATKETLPENLKLCTEIVLKPGESIGEHAHIGTAEIYYCIKGQAKVLENGEYVDFNVGDCAITIGDAPHAIKNESDEIMSIIAIIVKS